MQLASLKLRLKKCESDGLIRKRSVWVDKASVNFCSNNYLGLNQDPRVRKAFIEGVKKYGLGSGASALITGYCTAHCALEERFADFLRRDKAILFNSGYHANIGVITTLANRDWQIFLDRFCHASIIDAVLLSRARYHRYKHCDTANLNDQLTKSNNKPSLIISESIFSMEGSLAPVVDLANISGNYGALLMIDDAHGIGVLGENGRGICEQTGLNQDQAPILVAPLGKAFGSLGALVAGSADLIEGLVQFARTYRYTTALPPAIAYATLQVLKIIESENWRRQRLNDLINFFIVESKKRKIPLMNLHHTPIQTILIGDNKRVVQIKNKLFAKGISLAAIRPPTVPMNTARLRISLSCEHNKKKITYLLDCLAEHLRED